MKFGLLCSEHKGPSLFLAAGNMVRPFGNEYNITNPTLPSPMKFTKANEYEEG
ncbi:hypothetical protein SAMN02799616_05145 [Paenibacillus sp. UNC499MF]|nr:hypothetical protein SAMN02799616_05145 [Paenibacillus sp. UNC499MF]